VRAEAGEPGRGETAQGSGGVPWPDRMRLFSYAAQGAVVVIGGVYVLGFLTVNAYLASFGVLPLELWRPKYLAAGVLSAALCGPPIATGAYAWRLTRGWLAVASGLRLYALSIVGGALVIAGSDVAFWWVVGPVVGWDAPGRPPVPSRGCRRLRSSCSSRGLASTPR
jgi:hypothetical protein